MLATHKSGERKEIQPKATEVVSGYFYLSLEESDLKEIFSQYGTVEKVTLASMPNERIAFVKMSNYLEAISVSRALHNTFLPQYQSLVKVRIFTNFDGLETLNKLYTHLLSDQKVRADLAYNIESFWQDHYDVMN